MLPFRDGQVLSKLVSTPMLLVRQQRTDSRLPLQCSRSQLLRFSKTVCIAGPGRSTATSDNDVPIPVAERAFDRLDAHQVCLGHAHARINDGQGVVGLVGNDVNVQLWVAFQDGLVGEGLKPAGTRLL